mgnify:CR=1 FL=1
MPHPRNATPGINLHLVIPAEEGARLYLHLWSAAEQRIPDGARQRFFAERIREFFSRKPLDLGLFFPELLPGSYIYGPPALVEVLERKLNE